MSTLVATEEAVEKKSKSLDIIEDNINKALIVDSVEEDDIYLLWERRERMFCFR